MALHDVFNSLDPTFQHAAYQALVNEGLVGLLVAEVRALDNQISNFQMPEDLDHVSLLRFHRDFMKIQTQRATLMEIVDLGRKAHKFFSQER
jgi:hypothetical protein